MSVKRALVTGSAGFAGRHFVRALEACGYRVFGVDPADPRATRVDALSFFSYDETPFDLVVHCAAVVGGRQEIDGPGLALAVDLQLDAALFRWAVRARPGRIVYVSSSAAYPVAEQHLAHRTALREDMINPELLGQVIGLPDRLYGWAKLTGEHLAYRARQEGLAVTVIRPFSGYGEDQDPSYPFRAFAERAKGRADPFEIWGDPLQRRDFIHIDDIVAATLLMCDEGIDGPLNLGTGRATSMRDLAHMFAVQAGYAPFFCPVPGSPMGVEYRVADVTRLHEVYVPKVSLEEGIRRALK